MMKNIKTSVLVGLMVLSIALLQFPSISTYADEIEGPEIEIDDPDPISACYDFNTTVNGYWKTVLTDPSFNCNVRFSVNTGSLLTDQRLAICLYSGGTCVWTDYSINNMNTSVTLWCGSDVTSIKIAIVGMNGNPIGGSYSTSVRIQAPY